MIMEKTELPEAYGVLKPVGQVIVSFPPDADLQGAVLAFEQEGFAADAIRVIAAAQMTQLANQQIQSASVLATIGQELNIIKALRDLAEQGFNFVMVRASKDDEAARVARVALKFKAERAQKFGHLIIEELIPVGSDETQMSDTPDRGLDAQTRSGLEGDVPHR
jgi:hypothetical protein